MTARAGIPIALGFECPLFLPVPSTAVSLGAARQGEGNRAWSAGAGAGSLATGLVQVAWIARELKARVQDVTFSVDIQRFLGEPNGVLIW
ncbi:MAG: hypothetical protein ACREPM_20945 [Gemmatimonadaceae bacterium]